MNEFREMRRKRQQLNDEECTDILMNMTNGTLALAGDNGYPYAVPISYVYFDGDIWFHCARSGHKLDAIRRCDKVSFCVIAQDEIVPERFTTHYRSVIAFGRIEIVEDEETRIDAICRLAGKYSPAVPVEMLDDEINKGFKNMEILRLKVEHITGKESLELAREKGEIKGKEAVQLVCAAFCHLCK